MKRSLITITPPENFQFRALLFSHGWSDLEPFCVGSEDNELRCVLSLSSRKQIVVRISESAPKLIISPESSITLTKNERGQIRGIVRSMFRLDEPMDEFHALCKREAHLRWIPKIGAGRMLRSASVFEDIVKMICTTNCSWSLTKIIVNHLTTKLGTGIGPGIHAFPSPEKIASQSERWLRKETSSGYRAPYLLEFARSVASGSLSVEHLRTAGMETGEVYAFLRTIKGVGHYAAGNLLKLLGHYDYLSIDSWIRAQYSDIYKNGRTVSDATIERHYSKYKKWRGLVCWLEMTKKWHV